jgi:hypothetical protein
MSLNTHKIKGQEMKNSFNKHKWKGCAYNDEVVGQFKKNIISNFKGTVYKCGLHV